MMMKINAVIPFLGLVFLACFCSNQMKAQKEFTLEDLNFGGTNYHQMVPGKEDLEGQQDTEGRL